MKRVIFIMGAIFLTTLAFGILHNQTRAVRVDGSTLRRQEGLTTEKLAKLEREHTTLRQTVSEHKAQRRQSVQTLQLTPKLADWLMAGSYTEVSGSFVPELRAALGFPWNDSADYVLVSKATLRDLTLPTIGREDKLSRTLCAILVIGPEEQQQIESALAQGRNRFADWAKANLQREGPSGETLFSYTIPATPEQAQTWTNALFSVVQNAIGAERTGLLEKYTADWLRFEAGYLGAVTNTLKVFNRTGSEGKTELFYELSRSRNSTYGQTSESGRVNPNHLHPTFQNIFPGGWPELAQREGFELPKSFGK